MTCSAQGALA